MFTNRTRILAILMLAGLLLAAIIASAAADKIQSRQAGMAFDKAFLQSIKAVMTYEQIVKIVGVPPVKVAEASLKIPGEKYHWDGKENTSFNIRVISGKVVDANVVAADGRILSLEYNGEVNEVGK